MNFKQTEIQKNLNKRILENIVLYLILLFVILKVAIRIWALNKGLSMNDDGYYLFLLKDTPSNISTTNFFKFFHNFFKGDIFFIRIAVFIIDIFSVLVFSLGIFSYLKTKFKLSTQHFLIIASYCYIGFNLCAPPLFGVFSYVTINRQLMLISFGLLFIAFKKDTFTSITWYLLSGFIAGMLFFIMITNLPLLFFVLIFIYIETKSINNMVYYFIGIFLSFIYYFTFVESFGIFYSNIISNFHIVSSGNLPKGYGVISMIKWIVYIGYYIVTTLLIPILAILGLKFIKRNYSGLIYWLLLIACSLYIFFFYYSEVYVNGNINGFGVSSLTPVFVLALYYYLLSLSKGQTTTLRFNFILLGFLTPIFLTLGTIISFQIRATEYLMFILPAIYIFTLGFKNVLKYQLILFLVIISYSFNSITFLNKSNWARINYTMQNTKLSDIGINQSIKLDNEHVHLIKELKNYTHEGENVILSCHTLWGYAYLLNLTPLDYNFRINVHPSDSVLKKTIYLEDMEYPFDSKIKRKLNNNNADSVNVGNKFNVYQIK